MAVRSAFQDLLSQCGNQFKWILIPEWKIKRPNQRPISLDGALVDTFRLTHGFWEAKDIKDNLDKEVKKKFDIGYPKDNILFQTPERAILYQDGKQQLDEDITKSQNLVDTLKVFFEYIPPAYEQWEEAISDFKEKVSALGEGLKELIDKGRQINQQFITAFTDFMVLCRQSINPNLSELAVEEMLIQHLLTERLFRKVFNNPDFSKRNIIAAEIEKVIEALTLHSFSRSDFLSKLDRYYGAIETTASTISDYSHKQQFLNAVYEKFFQGFCIKTADTHGIVYTPQPIVDFMVNSVEDILKKEFGKSLSDKGVHILDPFVGTGNFIVRTMQSIKKSALSYKYQTELHCNEIMLLPYYIASMNIEHEYLELTNEYKPFGGICLVDTFELMEDHQFNLFTKENTQRVKDQKEASIFVIIGNPPYNASQVNENDNNKNRKYPVMDKRVSETYVKDSKATLKSQLYDPYVKAIRWAADRIGTEGIIALVTNNSFIDSIAFDGVRKHLECDFSKIYHINLKGNARTSGERRRMEAGNVFDDMIRVSVGITFFIKKKDENQSESEIYIYSIDDYLKSQAKKHFLDESENIFNIKLKKIIPDKNHTWLTEGLKEDFETFIPMGTKEAKSSKSNDIEVIFKIFSSGVKTNRDTTVYSFNKSQLLNRIEQFIEDYNTEVFRYKQKEKVENIDTFINYSKIKWDGTLKSHLQNHKIVTLNKTKTRNSLYRPYIKEFLYFEDLLINSSYRNKYFFPTPETEKENRVICVSGLGSSKPFHTLIVSMIPCLDMLEKTQCFPFYTYNEDGSNRKENITDWSLKEFRDHYNDKSIGKWYIFHYIYAVLHHKAYREKYQANLKRELPRIPYAKDFWTFAKAGDRLSKIHVEYESLPEHPLDKIENKELPLNYRVEKMKLSKDKKQIIYNDFLTLDGIPNECFEYRLGNRSALDWIIDQYQVKTDKRSGIVNDPNRLDDPEYIIRLIGQVISVSIETVDIVKSFPELIIKNSDDE